VSEAPKLKPGAGQQALGVVGALGGILIGKYTGLNLLIPLAGAFLCGYLFKKLAGERAQSMLAAFAVQGGHALWMVVGFLVVGELNWNVADVVLLVVGLVWLAAAPGLGPVLLLGIYHLFGLAMNAWVFAQASFGAPEHKALVVHIILRLVAVATLYVGWKALRARSQPAIPASSQPAIPAGPATEGPYAPPRSDEGGT
jgi:hypothetical protein